MRFRDLFQTARKQFPAGDFDADIRLLLEAAFGLPAGRYWLVAGDAVTDRNGVRRFQRKIRRLQAHSPCAYILGKKEFYSLELAVDHRVLIPRPETEILVERALQKIAGPVSVLDIGAGSGAIAIAIAKHSQAHVWALEKDRRALSVLRRNVARHGVGQQVRILASDLFPSQPLRFDAILANPPYLSQREWQQAPPQVRLAEPAVALIGGVEGSEILAAIIARAGSFLKPGGFLMLEIGFQQCDRIQQLLVQSGYRDIEFFPDLQGIWRIACARR